MLRNWWKFLGVLLLAYSIYAGLATPLAPGIISAKSSATYTSDSTFTVTVFGYNTRFQTEQSGLHAWLMNNDKPVCAIRVEVIDETHAVLHFPPVAPIKDPLFTLKMHSTGDGLLVMENAIWTADTVTAGLTQVCQPKVASEDQNYHAYPFRYILYESIRNLFLHVPMWFAMIALLSWSLYNNFRYLRGFNINYDHRAHESVKVALVFGMLGLITGSIWARSTWGAWWVDDTKLNGTAITMLSYLAYLVLRNSIEDEQKRARVSSIYSIFAYVMMLVLIGLLPRLNDSLHPGNGGNPAFSNYDLDNTMRPVFYAAVLGWIIIGIWISGIRYRMRKLKEAHT
jgi:heme exporter protein C